tara:strand:+ start:26508 stop:27356 length:849 start_codon:yes stop_codon:yes gene_type:complete
MAMNQQRQEKLKPLLNEVPQGFLVDAAWLVAREIDRKSILNYERRGWLEKVTRGLYRRPVGSSGTDSAGQGWKITVLSMQQLMSYDVHVGGKTALATHGLVHYLSFGDGEPVYLYGKPPAWLKRLPDAGRYMTRTRSLFGGKMIGVDNVTMSRETADKDLAVSSGRWSLTVSSPERAVLELLDELPDHESFHIADMAFESLSGVRPAKMQALLEACRSIKVKRLFFVFADRHSHAWLKYLEMDRIDLGSGPRALVEGGKFHPDYRISVPAEYLPRQEGDDGA